MIHPDLSAVIPDILNAHASFCARWPEFEPHPSLMVDEQQLRSSLTELFTRLDDNYPFFHPQYIGQMLKPPHPVAVMGYLAAMLINPNNHALDGGPATGRIEKEVVADIAAMFGYETHLGHLTSSGTIANLEALWIARELHPGRAIAVSDQAHYTHRRMCQVLGVRCIEVPSDMQGSMNLDALRHICLSEDVGTVVATIGTTGLGTLDPLHELVAMKADLGFRIHADAAYGGFFTLIAGSDPDDTDGAVFGALRHADSIVVDPHKHGLQPYGCGCLVFADPSVGRFYRHDSPYTYFTSDELHLGEISLECSRAGAAAAALWLTLQCLPLHGSDGLGDVLRACRSNAREFAFAVRVSAGLSLLLEPQLDIVVYFPSAESASAMTEASDRLFVQAGQHPETALYLSKLRVRTELITTRYPEVTPDREWTTVLRSVLMKPGQGVHASEFVSILETLALGGR